MTRSFSPCAILLSSGSVVALSGERRLRLRTPHFLSPGCLSSRRLTNALFRYLALIQFSLTDLWYRNEAGKTLKTAQRQRKSKYEMSDVYLIYGLFKPFRGSQKNEIDI